MIKSREETLTDSIVMILKLIGKFLWFAASYAFYILVLFTLWNWVGVDILYLKKITYAQSMGLLSILYWFRIYAVSVYKDCKEAVK